MVADEFAGSARGVRDVFDVACENLVTTVTDRSRFGFGEASDEHCGVDALGAFRAVVDDVHSTIRVCLNVRQEGGHESFVVWWTAVKDCDHSRIRCVW